MNLTPCHFIDGRKFKSMTEGAEAIGITVAALIKRAEKWQYPFSWVMPDRWSGTRKPCYFRGRLYQSRTEAARAHNISPARVRREIQRLNAMG